MKTPTLPELLEAKEGQNIVFKRKRPRQTCKRWATTGGGTWSFGTRLIWR